MCDVAGVAFTDTNSFTAQYIVDVDEVVMGTNSQVFAGICARKKQQCRNFSIEMKMNYLCILFICGLNKCAKL